MTTYWHAVGENLRLALDTVRTHKFRSFLTVLGVLIGTTTVIGVASIFKGLDQQMVEVAEGFGTRTCSRTAGWRARSSRRSAGKVR